MNRQHCECRFWVHCHSRGPLKPGPSKPETMRSTQFCETGDDDDVLINTQMGQIVTFIYNHGVVIEK